MDKLTWAIVAVGITWALWCFGKGLRLAGIRIRATRWMRSRRAEAVRRECYKQPYCSLTVYFLSESEAMYVCATHGLIHLTVGVARVRELSDYLSNRRRGCE